jgi:hypothetical protein
MKGTRRRYVFRSLETAKRIQLINGPEKSAQKMSATAAGRNQRRRDWRRGAAATDGRLSSGSGSVGSAFGACIGGNRTPALLFLRYLPNPMLVLEIPLDGEADALFKG